MSATTTKSPGGWSFGVTSKKSAYKPQMLVLQLWGETAAGQLPTLAQIQRMDDEAVIEKLTIVRGIGRVYHGGSFAKHTAVAAGFDLDVVVYGDAAGPSPRSPVASAASGKAARPSSTGLRAESSA